MAASIFPMGATLNYYGAGNCVSTPDNDFTACGPYHVILFPSGLCMIEFIVKIETIPTTTIIGGLDKRIFENITGKSITPINGGNLMYYTPEGNINASLTGYGGVLVYGDLYPNYWLFARVYNTSGTSGTWAPYIIPVGTHIQGTAFGKWS